MNRVLVSYGNRHALILGEWAEERAEEWIREQKERNGDEVSYRSSTAADCNNGIRYGAGAGHSPG